MIIVFFIKYRVYYKGEDGLVCTKFYMIIDSVLNSKWLDAREYSKEQPYLVIKQTSRMHIPWIRLSCLRKISRSLL